MNEAMVRGEAGRTAEPFRARRLVAVLGLVLASIAPVELRAQDGPAAAADACALADPARRPLCLEGVTAWVMGRGALQSAAAGGAPTAGTASTLGQRVPGSPRVAVGGGIIAHRVTLPGLAGRSPDGVAPLPEVSGTVVGFRGSAVAGVFQGFSRGPTVGGILAVDLLGNAGWLSLPGSVGFREGVAMWGIGARVGIFRESFTLPGISVSAVRHGVGRARVGDPGDPAVSFDTGGWSFRGVIGKDLAGFGLHAGGGVNRAHGHLSLHDGAGPPVFRVEGVPTTRPVLFAGATYTHLVFQLTGEAGWSGGEEAVSGRPPGSLDPGKGQLFGQLQGRIVF